MKKILFIMPIILASQLAHGVQLYVGNLSGNLSNVHPNAGGTNGYYKCTNSVSYSCQTTAISINYTSKTTRAGTPTDPHILSGCSFVSCACSYNEYLSGTTCIECDNNLTVTQSPGSYHTNSGSSACQYCPSDRLKVSFRPAPGVYVNSCETCPSNATCNGGTTISCNKGYYGTTSCTRCGCDAKFMYRGNATCGTTASAGKTSITDCYIPVGSKYYDSTGNFKITSNCPYKQ